MRRSQWVALVLASLTGALLVVTPAAGTPAAGDRAEAARAAEHRRILDYWTPERRASAKPADVVLPLGTKPRTNAKPVTGGGGDVVGAQWTAGGSVSYTTGKVFFTSHGSRYVCSGSVVDSGHNNLVLTAGHCVHDGGAGGVYHSDWVFYPRYRSGPDPQLGGFTYTSLRATDDWVANTNDYEDDTAFATVNPGSFASLEAAVTTVGSAANVAVTIPGIEFGQPTDGTKIYSFGYPAAQKYNGATLAYCSGPVSYGLDNENTLSIPCNMTGGSSGGPWFTGFGTTSNSGTLSSVNSYGYSSWKNRMFGPTFDVQESTAYSAVD